MTTSPDRPIRKFNPGVLQSDAEVIEQFVVRQPELGIVLDVLRGNIDSQSCQHALLVAPRGQGKTMLLARVAAELRTDEYLSEHLLAVRFMEESLEIFTLADFWLEVLFHLAREVATLNSELSRELRLTHADLAGRYNEASVEGYAFAAVAAAADRLDRQLVLMVENLQALSQSVDEDFGWKLRKILQCEPQIMLLGTATSRFAALDDAKQPFFEFFRMVVLEPLDIMGCRRLWEMVGGQPIAEREIRPLEILTGGNPRLLVILGVFARHRSFRQLMEELVGLIDEYTEYFRGHLDVLAKSERRVYLAVIDLWQPSTAAEVAARARMDIRPVSTLLGRLKERRVINIDNSGSKRLYSASERLYCIYYKLRRERDQAGVVRLLLQFMTAFYAPRESAGLLHEFWQEAESTSGFQPLLAEAVAESSQNDEALDHHLQIARDLIGEAQRHESSGSSPEEAVALYEEVDARFGRVDRIELQEIVATALIGVAFYHAQLGEPEQAVATCEEVDARFGNSVSPMLNIKVSLALLIKGNTLRIKLGNPVAARATFETVVARFGDSEDEMLWSMVIKAIRRKGSTHADLSQHAHAKAEFAQVLTFFKSRSSRIVHKDWFYEELALAYFGKGVADMQMGEVASAIHCFDILVGCFDGNDESILREIVALALFSKGVSQGKLGDAASAILSYDQVVTRYGAIDSPGLQNVVAASLVQKSVELLNSGQAIDALDTCEQVKFSFANLTDHDGIPFGWHVNWTQAKALITLNRTAEFRDTLWSLIDGFVPDKQPMVQAMLMHIPELIGLGVLADEIVRMLAINLQKAAALQPLVVALQQHAGEVVRAPAEVMEVAADILKMLHQQDEVAKHVAR